VGERRFETDQGDQATTLAGALRRHLAREGSEPLPWSQARKLCSSGRVTVDGERVVDGAVRLRAGQAVRVEGDQGRPPLARTEAAKRLVYEDPHLVVVDKPAGLPSVPFEPGSERPRGDRNTALDLVRTAWRTTQRGRLPPLFVVHRIDKETSGLLVFARTKGAERALAGAFREHAVERTYLCLAHGEVRSQRIQSTLVADRGDGLKGSSQGGRGQPAVTHVRALELLAGATFCEVRLETGRTHQVRIHLAETGHPILGERVYIRDFVRRGGLLLPAQRLMLHAATLGFQHPMTGAPIHLELPLPAEMTAALEALRSARSA
jgi:23S rRNA pseudouridine1911/1915/1917 synthase